MSNSPFPNQVAGQTYYRPQADVASLFWQKLSFSLKRKKGKKSADGGQDPDAPVCLRLCTNPGALGIAGPRAGSPRPPRDPPSGPRPPPPQGHPKPTTQPTNKLSSRLHRPGPGAKGLQGIDTPPPPPFKADGRKAGTPPMAAPALRAAAEGPLLGLQPRARRRAAHQPHLRGEWRAARRLPGPSATASRPLRRLRLRLRPLSAERTPARSPGPPGLPSGLPPPQPSSHPQTPELGAACGAAAQQRATP